MALSYFFFSSSSILLVVGWLFCCPFGGRRKRKLDPLASLTATQTTTHHRYLKFDFRRSRYTIEMSSFVDSDNEYVQMTIRALTELRKKLNLTPKHDVVPSDLEPPVWDVEKQVGIVPRTGKQISKVINDVSKLKLLPTHYRLYPKEFMKYPAPFLSEQNETLCRFFESKELRRG